MQHMNINFLGDFVRFFRQFFCIILIKVQVETGGENTGNIKAIIVRNPSYNEVLKELSFKASSKIMIERN